MTIPNNNNKKEEKDDILLHIDLLNFIEYLGEKYNIDTEKEWKEYTE